jgi:hypothetical protein
MGRGRADLAVVANPDGEAWRSAEQPQRGVMPYPEASLNRFTGQLVS